jgi:glycosyltransferase involved in cell wall biosynthesis
MKQYVLITPARNEAEYLPIVIDTVINQTIKPLQWIIVNDGSTDRTEEIVLKAQAENPFIKLVQEKGEAKRSFGSKAKAFKAGFSALHEHSYNYIGNLDADVSMEYDYYSKVIENMEKHKRLGVAGGVVWDRTDNGYKRTMSSLNHAVGAVQFWRRECYEAIGGYRKVTVGGVDSIAELTARMLGWETRSFPDLAVFHHKSVDSASGKTAIRISYRAGMTDYHIGTNYLFALLKAVRRWKKNPVVLSTIVRIYAYNKLYLTRVPRDAAPELVKYLNSEQLRTIKKYLSRSM